MKGWNKPEGFLEKTGDRSKVGLGKVNGGVNDNKVRAVANTRLFRNM